MDQILLKGFRNQKRRVFTTENSNATVSITSVSKTGAAREPVTCGNGNTFKTKLKEKESQDATQAKLPSTGNEQKPAGRD